MLKELNSILGAKKFRMQTCAFFPDELLRPCTRSSYSDARMGARSLLSATGLTVRVFVFLTTVCRGKRPCTPAGHQSQWLRVAAVLRAALASSVPTALCVIFIFAFISPPRAVSSTIVIVFVRNNIHLSYLAHTFKQKVLINTMYAVA